MSYETCFVNLNMLGKLPNVEIREDAAQYEEQGMPREAALQKAVEDRLTLAKAQKRTIVAAVRSAWEAQGGAPRPVSAPAAAAIDPAPTARPEAPPAKDLAPMADLNDMFSELLAEEAAAKPASDDLNGMFGELLAEVSGVDPRPTVASLAEPKPKKARAKKDGKTPYQMVEEVNENWRKLYRENAGWFNGDGPYKLKADAPADVKAAYKAHLAAKKAAKAAMDGVPLNDKPLAAEGLTSYRYKGPMGPVMIGAKNDADALKQAGRSINDPRHEIDRANLEVWHGKTNNYVSVDKAPTTVRATAESHIRKFAKTPGEVKNEQVRKVLLDAGPMAAEVAAILGEEGHLVTAVGKSMEEFGYKFARFDGLRPIFEKPGAAGKTGTPLDTTPVDQLIKIAADNIAELRKDDVLRVLESYPSRRADLAAFISSNRPELAKEVAEVLEELGESRSAGAAAVSAVKNVASGTVDALDALGALFGGNSTLGSGPVFNEETYAKAKPLFKEALAKYGQAGQDIRDAMRTIIKKLLDKFGYDTTANMQPYVVRYIEDYRTGKLEEGESNVTDGTAGRTQGDPQYGADGDTAAGRDLFNVDAAGAGRETRAAGEESDGAGAGQRDGAGVSGRDAAAGGTSGDQRVRAPAPGPDGSATESRDGARSGQRGSAGARPDAGASGRAGNPVTARPEQGSKLDEQKKAAAVPVKLGDRANIDATLPYLLDGQRDDVAFAEKRFAETANGKMPGVLFTNGTGTGKTFTGLGIIARQIRAGKTEGMILVPNNQIAQDWIDHGEKLGITIKLLDSTSDNGGKGTSITTYANFGDNPTLADRNYDWLLADESHYLMSSKDGDSTLALGAFRALTRHPAGFAAYSRMKNRDLYAKLALVENKESAQAKAIFDRIRKAEEQQLEQYKAIANTPAKRPKAIFLSATPFAYVKSVDYAEGYLFDYPANGKIGNSNQDGRAKFFVQHFGYRIRYHKLTEPDGNVDVSLMARQFNSYLKKEGALSGRMLEVEADYSRRFVMVESALGAKIDEGMEFMREHAEYKHLYQPFMKEFTYLKRRYLLEAIKAKEALPVIQQHLDMGRKVIVIHDYKKGGASNPFAMTGINGKTVVYDDAMKPSEVDLAELAEKFKAERPDLVRLDIPRMSALQTLTGAYPNALVHNGSVPAKQLEANKGLFNDDDRGRNVIILQSDKGREGISLHDTTGKYQRVEVVVGMAAKPTALIQLEGRAYRTGQVTDAIFDYVMTGTMWERWTFAQTIAERADIAEALAMGDDARALKDAIVEAFENAGPHAITADDGKGGKARDRQAAKLLTDWDRARSFYYGQVKRTSASKAAEGKDYFATPEPLGLKMVEWADIRPGEDVLEPSAGHGAIARWFPVLSNKTINEPSTELVTRTRLVVDGGARFLQGMFEDINIVNKYDAIVMNPPFGLGGSTAIPHVKKAYQHLREGGRIVALLPRGPAADAKLEKFLYGDDAPKDLYMVADINLPSSTFERAGTGVMTHIVILDKISDPAKAPHQVSRDYVSAEDIEEFFERIENSTVPGRVKTDQPIEIALEQQKVAPKKQPREAAPDATGAERYYAQFEFKHTKTGEQMYGAAMLNRTSMDTYKEALAIAKSHDGYYNKFVGGGALRGFLFKSDEDRAAFMAEAGQLAEVSEGLDAQNSLIERRERSIEVDGVRRPITNSEGRAVAQDFNGQVNFWKFFGDSKVVNDKGEPLVVYHGARANADIKRFSMANSEMDPDERGIYFTSSTEHAGQYATDWGDSGAEYGGSVYPAYLKMSNPVEVTAEQWAMRQGMTPRQAQAAGHDGFIIRGHEDGDTYIAFSPEQIKSAVGNAGTFDPANPDILASSMPTFYSALARTIPDMAKIAAKDGTIKPDQARVWLMARQKEGKFKADELLWSGVDDWLKAQGSARVAVADIAAFVEQNGVDVQEVTKGEPGARVEEKDGGYVVIDANGDEIGSFDYRSQAESEAANYGDATKYSQYVLPGGENYRELLLTLPQKEVTGEPYHIVRDKYLIPAIKRVITDVHPSIVERALEREHLESRKAWWAEDEDAPIAERARRELLAAGESDALKRYYASFDVNAKIEKGRKSAYKSSHWDEENIVAHIRFNDRVDADGKRVLFIEELQSDWGQDGLKRGFAQPETQRISGKVEQDGPTSWKVVWDDGTFSGGYNWASAMEVAEKGKSNAKAGLPAAPFVTDTKAWLSLGIKRMIRYAAENGYDRIAFVNGQQSADRYDLSKQVGSVYYTRDGVGKGTLVAMPVGSTINDSARPVMEKDNVAPEDLEDFIGKDLAKKLLDSPVKDGFHSVVGPDLKVGGEGMKTFYDKIVPQTINDVLKKLGGGKAGAVELLTETNLQQSSTYTGPTMTADELTAFMRSNRSLSSSVDYQLSEVRNGVADGMPFAEAMQKRGSIAAAEAVGGSLKWNAPKATPQTGFDITPELRASAMDGLPLFSKFDPTRRQLLAVAAAAAMGDAKAGDVTLGRARAINAAVLDQRVSGPVERILRRDTMGDTQLQSGQTSMAGAKQLREAMKAISLTGPKELRALAAQVAKLLPADGVMLTVDDRARMNVHGVVELAPMVHMRLFTAEGRTGLTYGTLIHEALHVAVAARYRSLSVGMVRSNDQLLGLSAPAAAKALAQFEAVWEEFREATRGEKFANRDVELAVTEARGNPDEFFVRALTDPLLQTYMAGKRYEGKTLWARFKDWIKSSLFGLSESGTAPSWLDAALAASGEVAQAMGGDRADFARMGAIRRHQASRQNSRASVQEDSPEFKAWFGDSVLVKNDAPEVLYHGTRDSVQRFDLDHPNRKDTGWLGTGVYLTDDADLAESYARLKRGENGPTIMPLYARLENPYMATREEKERMRAGGRPLADKWTAELKELGHDGVILEFSDGTREIVVFDTAGVKSAIGNNGNFDPNDPDIMASRRAPLPAPTWTMPADTAVDRLRHTLQDKNVDMKRAVSAVRDAIGDLGDKWDPYLQEELFHGRSATGFKSFLDGELRPLLTDMQARGVAMEELEEYLHMRHAEEANAYLADINDGNPDGLAGVSTKDAKDYLANLSPKKAAAYAALAARVDAIIKGTQTQLVAHGLEKQDTMDAWNAKYQHYVPLHREDMENGQRGNGTGSGYSIRGPAAKARTGSKRAVVNILANVAMARERAIVRSEKNRIAMSLYGLALQSPNPIFWKPINPKKNPAAIDDELMKMGLSPAERGNMVDEPKSKRIGQSGMVESYVNVALRNAEHVLAVRINGEDRFLFFNKENDRALRMAQALKNINEDQLDGFMGVVGAGTRYFASINTQYNPVFGVVNLVRDVGEGSINLSSTPIAGKQAEVLTEAGVLLAKIVKGKGRMSSLSGADAALWAEFQQEGGITGYRAMFARSEDRMKEIAREMNPDLWMESRLGKVFTANGTLKVPFSAVRQYVGAPLLDWLSDYNEALENITRLAAYKVAKAEGMSNQRAASLAKNLTVNFNRKGAKTRYLGALYAFFNAAVQGTSRMIETLSGPAGKKIMAGGMLLGVLQALMLAMADFDDEDIPEFVRAKNLIIPASWLDGEKDYYTIPLPLGFSFLPSIGRLGTEFALDGMKRPGRYGTRLLAVLLDMSNPLDSSTPLQMISPTVVDPLAALSENQDWTGRAIALEDRSQLKPTPGHTRAKETASAVGKGLSWFFNAATGGTDYSPGAFSPTPDEVDYLIGQFTGGVGREVMKAQQSINAKLTGEEVSWNKVPLLGRIVSDANDKSAVSAKFYDNMRELGIHDNELDGRRRDKLDTSEYLSAHPEAAKSAKADSVLRDIYELRNRRRHWLEKGDKVRVKEYELKIRTRMQSFNDEVEKARSTAQ